MLRRPRVRFNVWRSRRVQPRPIGHVRVAKQDPGYNHATPILHGLTRISRQVDATTVEGFRVQTLVETLLCNMGGDLLFRTVQEDCLIDSLDELDVRE